MDDIQQRCIELIAKVKQLPVENVTPESTFEELSLDSLDKVSLAFDVEEAFGIDIPESRLMLIRNVHDVVSGVQEALAAKADKMEPQ